MKYFLYSFSIVLCILIGGAVLSNSDFPPKTFLEKKTSVTKLDNLREGDIIFQSSVSAQCAAIQEATKSIYSHCGILFKKGNEMVVYEAVQPVRITPLKDWIKRGKDGHYVIKRLQNADKVLTDSKMAEMKKMADGFLGKNYDSSFEWSDENIYCSELVWKLYDRTLDIEVGKIQKLREFDLSSAIVKQTLSERYGKNIPLEEDVISPGAIFDSPLLINVISN